MAVKDDPINELIKKNPQVDGKQLREAQRLLEELRKGGLSKPRYEIEPPYGSRPRRSKSDSDESSETQRRGRR